MKKGALTVRKEDDALMDGFDVPTAQLPYTMEIVVTKKARSKTFRTANKERKHTDEEEREEGINGKQRRYRRHQFSILHDFLNETSCP